ncbi:catechol 2,3-dioxygenase-like lactoylglutathione lyase family enzyme [Scopulibacillus darangshiensis]|uniref:Catechol 2,3-dioxygenase-like lactoylglutathione lyase family enzyme n=1 Tax=Scopulibacillus darangshiensis TaxID=442528 RepID=A0A4R2P700_9BACL|nr:VOC family protein [Scopulibacillus darangshiensis]TCP30547.1 catechol 2,3-dioxygenase-like lactoylglutathione lyase family enzyme [Scopulibacillus darangshiensis]
MCALIKAIDHVQVCIPPGNENKARKFYSDILGLPEIEKPDALKPKGGLWYQIGPLQLHIGVENMTRELGKRHVAFEVVDIEEARTLLNQKSIPIKNETPIPNVDRFSFRDPFGNRIELLQKVIVHPKKKA